MIRTRLTGFAAMAAVAALACTAMPALAEEEAAAEKTKVATVGEPAPQFELTDLDGEKHKLSDYKGQIVVLHWQSLQCPWEVGKYEPIISGVYNDFKSRVDEEGKQRVVFLGINSNHTESVEALKAYSEEWELSYPILKDDENKIADVYQARTTPHLFIIDEEQTLRYMGHPETIPARLSDVGEGETQYLVPTLNALLNGEAIEVTETPTKGCTIKRVER